MPEITLVIPVYNEENNLVQLLDEIHVAMCKQSCTWDVLFIDDGSKDNTLEVLRALSAKHPFAHYLSFETNQGQSAAFAAGFQEGRGNILVTLDSDLQNDPSDIPAMLALFDQGYDMVIGWRAKRQDNAVKRVSSRIANAVRNALSRESVKDTGCSLKVLRASMARSLPMFTGMHRFLPTLMKMKGAKVAEIRVNHRPRLHGVSKYGVWDRALPALYDLLAVRWMQVRTFTYRIRERH